jgi:hypothetical protein
MNQSYVLPANTNPSGRDSVERKRRLAEAMLAQGMQAEPIRSPWQGAAKIAQAMLGGNQVRKADEQESEGRKSAMEAFNAAVNGGGMPQITGAMGNEYLGDGQQRVLAALLQDNLERSRPPDPMDALELERARLEVGALKNPKPQFSQLSPDEVQQLGLPPGVYQRGPDGRIDTVEKTQAAADPIADLRARATAAGLSENTPEYQAFMANNGKTPDGMVIESDGQGGFRMMQGAGANSATSKPFTEGQSKDVVFATRAEGALTALDPIANNLTDRKGVAAGWIPMGLGGGMQSSDYQVARTAGDEFLQAILRKDTGAAITNEEQVLYGGTYLPQPGDGPERLAYKAQARQRAVAALKAGMSPAQLIAQERALDSGGAATPQAQPAPGNEAAPQGVDPAIWQHMTPEERALWK